MNKKQKVIIITFLTIITILLYYNTTLPSPIASGNGETHYYFAVNHDELYPNGVGILSSPFLINNFTFWFFWFLIIALAFPIIYLYFTKDLTYLIGFYFFTGIFFMFDSWQMYAQILALLPFLIVFLNKKHLHNIAFLLVLIVLDVFGFFVIHHFSLKLFLLLFVLELGLYLNSKHDLKGLVLGCGVATNFVGPVQNFSTGLGDNVGFFYWHLSHWAYLVFLKIMPFWLSLIGFFQIFKEKDLKSLFYLVSIFFVAVLLLVNNGFFSQEIRWDEFGRILMIGVFVLFPGFMRWLSNQKYNVRVVFWCFGLVWFFLQLFWYFGYKGVGVGC